MKKLNFPTKYDRKVVSKSFKNVKSMTDQQFADMCSVDAIIKRFGVLPKPDVPMYYGDVSMVKDFQSNHEQIAGMTEYFQSLPSDLRDRFKQSPAVFFAWLADPKNRDDAVKIGIFEDNSLSKVETLLGDIAKNTQSHSAKE